MDLVHEQTEKRSRPFERRNRFDNHAGNRNRGRLPNIRPFVRLRPASPDRNRSCSTRCQLVRRKRASHRKNRPTRLRRLRAHGCVAVPKQRLETEIAHGIPVTYVPARNTIFLAYALAWAEVIPANDIFLGVNAIDYSGYPDCRPEFIAAFENLANVGTKAGVEGRRFQIHTPLIKFSKTDIIRKAVDLGVDLSLRTVVTIRRRRSRLRRMRFLSSAAQRLPRSRNHRSNSLREKMKRHSQDFRRLSADTNNDVDTSRRSSCFILITIAIRRLWSAAFRIFEVSDEQRVMLIIMLILITMAICNQNDHSPKNYRKLKY